MRIRALSPRRRLCFWALLCFACCAWSPTQNAAEAGKWPGHAGGESASGDPELLLTFDDGPHEKHTRLILDALEEHRHQAIFFWTGHRVIKKRRGLAKRLALVERAVLQGHLVGNHTVSHSKLCTVGRDEAEREIDENAVLYEKLTDLPMILFRVPYGARCKRLDKMLKERDLDHLHWDLDPQDFKNRSADVTFRYVTTRLKRLKDGKRAVLLMHDTQPSSAKALPKILQWIVEENERREKKGRRPIRIINASSWVADERPMPLVAWGQESMQRSTTALRQAATKLLP